MARFHINIGGVLLQPTRNEPPDPERDDPCCSEWFNDAVCASGAVLNSTVRWPYGRRTTPPTHNCPGHSLRLPNTSPRSDTGEVLNLALPLDYVAEGYLRLDECQAIKVLLRP